MGGERSTNLPVVRQQGVEPRSLFTSSGFFSMAHQPRKGSYSSWHSHLPWLLILAFKDILMQFPCIYSLPRKKVFGVCLSIFIRPETNTASFNFEAFVACISLVLQITDSRLHLTPNKQANCYSSISPLPPSCCYLCVKLGIGGKNDLVIV